MSCAFSSAVAVCGAVRRNDGARRDCRMAQTPRACAGFGSCPSLAAPLRGRTTQSAPQRSTSTAFGSPLLVTCMANPRRVAKVQQQMRREISNMLQTDKNLRNMISPEERMGVDNVISVMATVADVEVSNDLQVVKVFVSILGDERGKKNAINGLKKMEGYVRRNIGKKVSLRLTPEIRFVYDDSFERGQKVSALLDELREERDGRQFTSEELAAVEDTISNPYDDDDDDDEWMEELGGSEDDDGEVEDEDGNNR